jgi:hypothetical protein
MIVAVLIVLAFAGDKVRGYFKRDTVEVARESSTAGAAADTSSGRGDPNPSAGRYVAGNAPSSNGTYVPSPADAPVLYDSPTKRLGF